MSPSLDLRHSGTTGETGASALSVSALTRLIKGLLEGDPSLRNVWVRGEVSNLQQAPSGHIYFTLKDAAATIGVVMFARAAHRLRFALENGLETLVRGHVSVFERRGQYQLYAHEVEPAGLGSLHLAFQQLKERLEQEGLFAQARKRPLPAFPRCVALVTSPSGAAVQDIIRIARRRFPGLSLVIIPVLVQGTDAPTDIVRGLSLVGAVGADVVIVGRGGGSLEQLWAFNTEEVARAIRACPVPIVSAVGHETDVTIADFVADLRAPTPSAAAELVIPERLALEAAVSGAGLRIMSALTGRLRHARERLDGVCARRVLQDPRSVVDGQRERLDHLLMRLSAFGKTLTAGRHSAVALVSTRLAAAGKGLTLRRGAGHDAAATRVLAGWQRLHLLRTSSLRESVSRVDGVSPLAVLGRGYSVCRIPSGAVVRRPADAPVGSSVEVVLADGRLQCEVVRHEAGRTEETA